jgi:hypothetical protein
MIQTLSAVWRQEDSVEIGWIVTIGASNAASTAAALSQRGLMSVAVARPGWTITKNNMETALQEAAADREEGNIMLVHWLENSIFCVLNKETGNMDLLVRNEDGGFSMSMVR